MKLLACVGVLPGEQNLAQVKLRPV
jgi:hypothetical protein